MSFTLILFYIFAAIILYGALQTITAKNPVHATLHLVLTFCVSAMMWLLMQAEFLGLTLVVVYVGAVMVLFLFVIMMLNIDVEEMRRGFWQHAPAAVVVGILMAVLLIAIFVAPDTNLAAIGPMNDLPADYSNVRDLGMQLYTTYLWQFELAAILLVLGMVAAIALVHRKSTNPKYINPADQVKVNPAEGRLRMVSMRPEFQTPKTVETQPENEQEQESQS
ncbi:MAG: NADH-quinone oxidoreductase subunit J [Neisseriaceae bacterium]|nr:NADH-quinone oxidoreductase subunit J [Neisseriaceae bacterium]